MYFPAHFQLTFACAGILFLVFGFRRNGGYHQFRHCCLEFDIVGSGQFCGMNHLNGAVVVAIMIYAGFCDYYDFLHRIINKRF